MYGYQRGNEAGEGINWEFEINIYTLTVYKLNNQKEPTVQHKEVYSMSCHNL